MNLQQLRKKIDQLDQRLLALLNDRSELVKQVGALKKASSQPIFDPQREEELLRSLERHNQGPLTSSSLRAIYREIFSSSRSLQQSLKIAFLGPEGTYSHQAALSRFGSNEHFVPCRTIPEIFAKVSRGEVDTGMVPVENSSEGAVGVTHDSLISTDLVICGESYLKINHSLATNKKDANIERIYSHPQALGQCRQWLQAHYPNAEQREIFSTADGAQRVKDDPNSAAILSSFAADLYKLHTLSTNISDIPGNTTRFLILSRIPAKPSLKDKTSLLFAVAHQVGALSQVLAIFAEHKLNLQKIESRPAPYKAWEYLFFVDVSGHNQKPVFKKAMNKVLPKTLWMKVLGSYPEGETTN